MTKKTFNIVVGVLTAVSTAAVALVPIIWPSKVQVISSAITVVFGAAIEICSLFTEDAVVEKGGKEEGA